MIEPSIPTMCQMTYGMSCDRDPTQTEGVAFPNESNIPKAIPVENFQPYIIQFWHNTVDKRLFYLQSATLIDGGNPNNASDYILEWSQIQNIA